MNNNYRVLLNTMIRYSMYVNAANEDEACDAALKKIREGYMPSIDGEGAPTVVDVTIVDERP